ncbi:deleted in malignant brain tumors 1 protein-like [Scyliorhinus canicula]|uniref:deleted in malignant brain tumors 1 protein-like n=1 Tax=Scyliorhinus canicula TaxID=7830 RepID=UPI0018F5A836|nr:deleted in malignant brain tumors 1 protein-like [Scyliorhinus canicula]
MHWDLWESSFIPSDNILQTVLLDGNKDHISSSLRVNDGGICELRISSKRVCVTCFTLSADISSRAWKDAREIHVAPSSGNAKEFDCQRDTLLKCIRCYNGDKAAVTLELQTLRLVDGGSPCSGRLEIHHRGQWGNVLHYNWDVRDAAVVCRELDCGTPLFAPGRAHFGEGTGTHVTGHVECTGTESALSQCPSAKWGHYTGLPHFNDAGVICSELQTLRLVDGGSPCSGRLEIHYRGQWGNVLDSDWDVRDAAVVCRGLDCGTALSAPGRAHFGEGNGTHVMGNVGCTGTESALWQCPSGPWGHFIGLSHYHDAGVICSGKNPTLRLVDGGSPCSGRLEIHYRGQWGNVLDSDWDVRDAAVVCRGLDCGTALSAPGRAHFGEGNGTHVMGNVGCTGTESALWQCPSGPWGHFIGLSHYHDAGVICSGSLGDNRTIPTELQTLRLVDGGSPCSGRLEIHYRGQWGNVLDYDWDVRDAAVVCRELDCGTALSAEGKAHFGEGNGTHVMGNVECTGTESALWQCPSSAWGHFTGYSHSDDAGVICSGSLGDNRTIPTELQTLRLVDGDSPCSGRLEIHYRGQWGNVLDSDWVVRDAAVVCRELDCGTPLFAPGRAHFGEGNGTHVTGNIECTGTESALSQCPSVPWGHYTGLPHFNDAGVICSELQTLRLVDGGSPCSGRLEIHNRGQWGNVLDSDWDVRDAAVVCRELDCGTPLFAPGRAHFGEGNGTYVTGNIECTGTESALSQCPSVPWGHYTGLPHFNDAGVICSGRSKPRLVNGSSPCAGRLEIYSRGSWATVWGNEASRASLDADIVCKELECGSGVAMPLNSHFGEGSGHVIGPPGCGHQQDIGVICSGTNSNSWRNSLVHKTDAAAARQIVTGQKNSHLDECCKEMNEESVLFSVRL